MSVRKEPARPGESPEQSSRRFVQVEVEVPGTPEEVWAAIATGPGISSWFVPTTCDQRAGGQMVCTFGPGMDCPAAITSWDAPKRFATDGDMGAPGSPRMATEWTVEARAGGTCMVRVVHSLFASTDEWDNQLDGLEQGWPTYFRILRMYLERYKGMPCASMHIVNCSTDSQATAWEKVGGALGLLNVAPGQTWSTPSSLPPMTGMVDSLGQGSHKSTVLLRVNTPAPGSAYVGAFGCGGMVMVCMSVYLYGDNAAAAVQRDQPAWQTWFNERVPMPQMG